MPTCEIQPSSVGTVVHRNDLFIKNVGALERNDLRLLLYVISQIPYQARRTASEVPAIKVPLSVVATLLGYHGPRRGWICALESVLDETIKCTVSSAKTKKHSDRYFAATWFSYIYRKGEEVVFGINPILSAYVVGLQKNFTMYELGYAFLLKRIASIRLYDYLKGRAFRGSGSFTVPLNELRTALGLAVCDESGRVTRYKVPEFGQLKKAYLVPAVEEINEKTDLDVSFTQVAAPAVKGRPKVEAICFTVQKKPQPPQEFGEYTALKNGGTAVDSAEVQNQIDVLFFDGAVSQSEGQPVGADPVC